MKKALLLAIMMIVLSSSCYAENWVQFDDVWSYDSDSIRHMQIGYQDYIKVKIHANTPEGIDAFIVLINFDNHNTFLKQLECFDINGNLIGRKEYDPSSFKSWFNGRQNEKIIEEIVKRAN